MYRTLCNRLANIYTQGEASAIVFMVLEKLFGLSRTDVIMGRCDQLSPDEQQALGLVMDKLEQGVPVQYALGEADFDGLCIHVESGVLIPRPETEELVEWIADEHCDLDRPLSILDIGTGSGCIALALANRLPKAKVTAWDISDDAIRIATDNAQRLGLGVQVEKHDALKPLTSSACAFDVIVSNPPYICENERKDMEPNVLNHEPGLALFVPDSDPLLFYRAIAQNALCMLKPSGRLYFEINRQFGRETAEMLCELGYSDIEVRKDFMENDRFVSATLKHPHPAT